MTDTLMVYCTFPSLESAEAAARQLVDQRCAACVNVLDSVRSVYRWEGEVCVEGECLTISKTTKAGFERLKRSLLEIHPYDCPEVVAVSIADGHEAYLQWVAEETKLE